MAVFRFLFAFLLLGAAPCAAQQLKPLGAQWVDAVRDEDGAKVNKIAADRSSLNSAVLDYQRDGEGAIHIVARKGNAIYLRFMLALGANPNLVAEKSGETPLTMAVVYGQPEIVQVLLDRARIDQQNRSGETALVKAVVLHRTELIQVLLAKGADPDKADYTGRSARAYAAADTRYPQIAKLLAAAPKRSTRTVAGPRLN